MFDLRDLYALPIAFSLTLWDAFPLYISLSLALAILSRVLLSNRAFASAWRFREVIGVEGLLYLALFRPSLTPTLLVAGLAMLVVTARVPSIHTFPKSPGTAMKDRFGEIIGPLLAACAASAIIKVFAPSLPEHSAMQAALALAGSMLVGNKSGTSAIPAVAIAVHLGGFIPASAWILGSSSRMLLDHIRHTKRVAGSTLT